MIGIDKSEEYVAIAKKDFPEVEFLQLDVLKDYQVFIDLAKKNNINKLFIDINGNRPLKAVEAILEIVEPNLNLECIIVKSEELFQKWKGKK